MKRITLARRTGVPAIFTAMLLIGASVQAQQQPATPVAAPAEENIVTGYTSKPYVSAKPGVNQFGTVLELPVKEGQAVKKGDIVLRQDDRQERAVLEALELEANSEVRIEAAAADLKLKSAQYKREQELLKTNSTNPVAVEEAESKWIYADAQLKIAKLEQEKNKREFQRQSVK
ncbi:MAG: biotin/lipoyl-binding protein, partial [Tepidisphaeraceae bacterium]